MSEDKARHGGDLGWKRRQEVVGAFADAAFKLEVTAVVIVLSTFPCILVTFAQGRSCQVVLLACMHTSCLLAAMKSSSFKLKKRFLSQRFADHVAFVKLIGMPYVLLVTADAADDVRAHKAWSDRLALIV